MDQIYKDYGYKPNTLKYFEIQIQMLMVEISKLVSSFRLKDKII